MKLMSLALAGLFALAVPGIAEAQWSRNALPPGYAVPGDDGYDSSYPHRGYEGPHRGYERRGSRAQLAATAAALAEHAEHVAYYLRAADPRSPAAHHALAVARGAALFHSSVQQGAPLGTLDSALRHLDRELRLLARDLERAHHVHHDHHFREDVGALTSAFGATARLLERELAGYGGYDPRGYVAPSTAYPVGRSPVGRSRRPRWEVRFGL